MSNEGNSAVGFNNLMYVAIITDAFEELNENNFDFMYQTVLCWAGILSTLPSNQYQNEEATPYHIVEFSCIREIREEILEAPSEFKFPTCLIASEL